MKRIESYKITWNTAHDEGVFLLNTTDGGLEQLLVDSAAEGSLVLDILRNEKPVFCENGLLFTGFELVGEGEEDNDS
ncbi:MAG: hypothetical protein AAF960_26955 [Bacteroidota bacterium]